MKTILIADDKPAGRDLVRTVLESCGYTVLEGVDGKEALLQARQYHPDLIILDLHMPGLDGFGVIAELRSDPQFDSTPIVALTATAMQGDRERAMSAGFTGYLAKPIRLAHLRSEVNRLLQ
jgi:CheY-like chemotaxis protein